MDNANSKTSKISTTEGIMYNRLVATGNSFTWFYFKKKKKKNLKF